MLMLNLSAATPLWTCENNPPTACHQYVCFRMLCMVDGNCFGRAFAVHNGVEGVLFCSHTRTKTTIIKLVSVCVRVAHQLQYTASMIMIHYR